MRIQPGKYAGIDGPIIDPLEIPGVRIKFNGLLVEDGRVMDEERSAIKSLRRIVLETTLKRISLPGIAQPSCDVVGVQNEIPDDERLHIGRRGSTRRGRRRRPRYIAACSRESADECERCGAQQTPPDSELRHSSRAPPNALQRAAGA